ncbi:MAG: hypothetical protein KGY61_00425 [Desulfobacterales bacterium]|nr:hypothetical protein [Desulfobacterales bacterium]
MNNSYHDRPNLQVINGGLYRTAFYGPVRIVAAPPESPPFAVEAMAYEEDTFLIMSADPDEVPTEVHPIRMMRELEHFEPQKIGSVVVKKGTPLRLLAVVHDVNQEPTCREKWVEKALYSVFQEVERRGIQSLGMPLLATRHGRLPRRRLARLLGRVLAETELKSLKKLWITAPVPDNCDFFAALKANLPAEEA